jgi:adenylate cyclase class 1
MIKDIKSIKKHFFALNRERLNRTQESLRWKQRDFLELLPLLFHINHPMLPGYTTKNAPAGIMDYTPTEKSLAAAHRFSKTFQYKKRALRTYDIRSIFLMGSSGTVAYSEKSDFDIWICHKSTLSSEQLQELQNKATLIEQWAATIDLEVNFFLMDADKFRQGSHVDLSSESSGTAQHHLLLEEFYRTGLLIAGQYPIWWLVPPEKEKEYDEYVNDLIKKRFISSNESIDFGGLGQIPAEEFFGAALWQVYKGIDSPYKSVLKILLMETYAQEYPNIDLLSLRFKEAIYSGEINIDRLDPYVMLLHKLDHYLSRRNELQRVELVRRCFYFKVNMVLSKPVKAKDINWRRELMESLTQKWEWNEGQLTILDARDSWKIHRVLKERKILVEELTNSYLFLSNFARQHARLAHISQSDLNILGRKLYAAFERKAGKVEIVNRGIAPNLSETHLMLQQVFGRDNQESWLLFPGNEIGPEFEDDVPLKRGRSIVALLAWCHFNKLMNARTIVSLRTQTSIADIREVSAIIKVLQQYYKGGDLPRAEMSALSQPPKTLSSLMFVNVGIDPMNRHSRLGSHIISNKNDALNYSGFSLNLVIAFDVVQVTSWQEVLTFTYNGINGLLEYLCQHLQRNSMPENLLVAPPLPRIFTYSSNLGLAITHRLETLVTDITEFFNGRDSGTDARYILECEHAYFVIGFEQGILRHHELANYSELLKYLALPTVKFTPTKLDRYALPAKLLPVILNFNKEGIVQLFFYVDGSVADIFVADENGSLFHQQLPFFDEANLVNQFDQFFASVLQRQNLRIQNRDTPPRLKIDFYKVIKNKTGKYLLEKRRSTRDTQPRKYFNVQVIGNVEENNAVFTIYCNDREFSSYEFGSNLFKEVARHVINLRRSGLRYPIYITDIDLAPPLLTEDTPNQLQTINFLNYKKRIEDKLNREMSEI